MLWLYGQPWFLDFDVGGQHLRTLFQIHPINLSVAVWVGFLALFGIATDDGVVIATYLKQTFERSEPRTIALTVTSAPGATPGRSMPTR